MDSVKVLTAVTNTAVVFWKKLPLPELPQEKGRRENTISICAALH